MLSLTLALGGKQQFDGGAEEEEVSDGFDAFLQKLLDASDMFFLKDVYDEAFVTDALGDGENEEHRSQHDAKGWVSDELEKLLAGFLPVL